LLISDLARWPTQQIAGIAKLLGVSFERKRGGIDMRLLLSVFTAMTLEATSLGLCHSHSLAQTDSDRQVVIGEVRGQWRKPDNTLHRITGKVKVVDAHTLRYADGTLVDLNGAMDAPDLNQKGQIGGSLYPLGKEAADFLDKLIGGKEVTCYGENVQVEAKQYRIASAFVGEMNLNIELVRNGWAMAHHSGMAAWEVIARDHKRGIWRGQFIFPETWRKGERLPGE
jgi:endonuclease YncB( thermonuclease family)